MPQPPVPTRLRLLRGNPGKRRINPDEPQPGTLPSDTPEELAGDAVAVAEWQRSIVPAIEIGLVTASDRAMAIGHCVLFAQWRAESAAAATEPAIVAVGRNHYLVPHPARVAANRTLQLLRAIDAELGFTPASRSKVTVDPRARRQSTRVESFMARKRNPKG